MKAGEDLIVPCSLAGLCYGYSMARILVIDDDEDIRCLLRQRLQGSGHSVAEAENGRVGLDRLADFHPDLVVTDLLMPVMEGIETIQRLKKAAPALRIVAMSGGGRNPGAAYLTLAQKMGASAVLAKPFSGEEFDLTVAALLGPEGTRARIFLVLDDDSTGRLLNRCILESEFPDSIVLESESIENALKICEGKRLDAVITDHHLGEEDGGMFVEALRERGVVCPIVMVTNGSDPEAHARALAAGASRVFHADNMDFASYLSQSLPR